MHAVSIQGSPRREGNTAKVLGWVEDELSRKDWGVTHIHVADFEVRGCIEDYTCQKTLDAPGCAVRDDGNRLLEQMMAADLIVLASPLFCWGFTAQMKALIDRSICLWKYLDLPEPRYLLKDKAIALVCTAAGPKEDNMDLIGEAFARYVEHMKAIPAGQLMIPGCTVPDAIGPDIEEAARAFARRTIAAVSGGA